MEYFLILLYLYIISAGIGTIATHKETHAPFRMTMGVFFLLVGLFYFFNHFLHFI